MKNILKKIPVIASILAAILFFLISCNNYLFNTGIREYISQGQDINSIHAITFNANGGTGKMPIQEVASGVNVTLSQNTFTMETKGFAGWNTQADGHGVAYAEKGTIILTNDITLYAQWSTNFYTITFNANTGIGIMDEQKIVNDVKTKLNKNTFERSNYTFAGWTTEKDKTEIDYLDEAEVSITENTILYAQWTLSTQTITFYANGGSASITGEMEVQTVKSGVSEVLCLNNFIHSDNNYRFDGWNTEENGTGTAYADEATINIKENTNLYAQWVEKTKVTFDGNGSTDEEMTQQIIHSAGESYLNQNTYTYLNHVFVGWNTSKDGTGTPFADGGLITFTESKTLYAQWALQDNIYTITFNGNGGTVAESTDTIYTQFVVKSDSAQLKPKTFVHSEKAFIAWNTNKDGTGTTYQNNETIAIINGNTELFAQWGYTVRFDSKGGSEIPFAMVIASKSFDDTNRPSTPIREGYTFDGWYSDETLTTKWDLDNDKVEKDLTLYAKWTEILYTITFNANNGTGSMDELIVKPLTETELPQNEFEKTGYLFTTWNTEQDGSGDAYADKALLSTNKNITLYAQWKKNIAVTFNTNGGEGTINGTMENQIVPSDVATKLTKNNFTHNDSNYTFTGWNTKSDGTGSSYADEANISISEDLILYAQWASEVWVITYYGNGGSLQSASSVTMYSQNAQKGSSINLQLNNFVRTGYEFIGWNTKDDGTGTSYINYDTVVLSEDITLYAQWSTSVTITYSQNWGLNATQTQVVTAGLPVKLQKNKFEQSQHYFIGWNSQSDGNGKDYSNEQENVVFPVSTILYAQWVTAPYSDENANTIISNGYNLKLVNDGVGTTVKWLYDEKEIPLQDIYSGNIKNGSDLSGFIIKNTSGKITGDHELEGGTIRGIEGMNSLSIQGNLTIGSSERGGIVLTKDNQLTIAGKLTGSNGGVIIRSHTIKQGDVIAEVSEGGNPSNKLIITDQYGHLSVNFEYNETKGQLLALGQLGLTPSDSIVWDDNSDSFVIPEIVLGVDGTIFSLSAEGGYFTVGSIENIIGAKLSMGIPIDENTEKPSGYSTVLKSGKKYSYVQFFPDGASFPSERASDFVQSLTFTPTDSIAGMRVKINLETLSLAGVNVSGGKEDDTVTYFNGSFYKLVTHDGDGWVTGYETAKKQTFNGLEGYLMNITSDSENAFIYDKVLKVENSNGVDCWIGGTRLISKDGYDSDKWEIEKNKQEHWYWAAGPEAGTIFYHGSLYNEGYGTGTGSAFKPGKYYEQNIGLFNKWSKEEPNNRYEFCAHYYATRGYQWNDYNETQKPIYSIVEFTPYGDQVATARAAFAQELYIKK